MKTYERIYQKYELEHMQAEVESSKTTVINRLEDQLKDVKQPESEESSAEDNNEP